VLTQESTKEGEDSDGDQYPTVFFLGTASASPSLHRNVSSYLVQLASTSFVMVDCGEGTYGQMRVLFGPEKCDKVLGNLNAVFITHAHMDHMNGLISIILRRKEIFDKNSERLILFSILLESTCFRHFI
jgi:ribonuclease Z